MNHGFTELRSAIHRTNVMMITGFITMMAGFLGVIAALIAGGAWS